MHARSRCRPDHRTDHRERAHSVAGDRRAHRIVADRAAPMPMQRADRDAPMQHADRHATWSRRRARAGARQVALPAGSSHGSPRASPQRRRRSPRVASSPASRCRCSVPIATPPGHAGELEPARARSPCRSDHRTDHRERAHSVAGNRRAHRIVADRARPDADAACRSPRHLVTPASSSRCAPGRAAGRIIARITASEPTASPAITARRIVAGVAMPMQRADRRGRHLVTPASSSRCTPGRAAGRIIARITASEPTAPPAIAAHTASSPIAHAPMPMQHADRHATWSRRRARAGARQVALPAGSSHGSPRASPQRRRRSPRTPHRRRSRTPRCRCSVPIAAAATWSRRRARAGARQVALPAGSSHGSPRASPQRRRRSPRHRIVAERDGDAACRSPRPPPGHAGELEPVHARSRCRPDHRTDHCERAHSAAGDRRAPHRRRRRDADAACRSPRHLVTPASLSRRAPGRPAGRIIARITASEPTASPAIAAHTALSPIAHAPMPMQHADRHATWSRRRARAGARQVALPAGSSHGSPRASPQRRRRSPRTPHCRRSRTPRCRCSVPIAHAPMQHADRHATWSRRRARAGARQVALPAGSSHGSPRASPQRRRRSPRVASSPASRCRCSVPIATPPGHAGELEPARAWSPCRSDHRTDHRERAHSVAGNRRAHRIVADRARPDADAACRSPRHLVTPASSSRCAPGRAAGRIIARITASEPTASPAITARRIVAGVAMPMQRADRHATWSRRRA